MRMIVGPREQIVEFLESERATFSGTAFIRERQPSWLLTPEKHYAYPIRRMFPCVARTLLSGGKSRRIPAQMIASELGYDPRTTRR